MKEKAQERQDAESASASTDASVRIAKATQKVKSTIARLDNSKMYIRSRLIATIRSIIFVQSTSTRLFLHVDLALINIVKEPLISIYLLSL